METRTFRILYIEDDEADVELFKSALHDVAGGAATAASIEVADDGEKALTVLNRLKGDPSAPRPDVVLLDLNLPRVHGLEVLRYVKSVPELKRIPVIILSTSNIQRDVDEAYALGANSYLVKPTDYNRYKEIVQSFYSFWFQHVMPPSLASGAVKSTPFGSRN